MRKSNQTEDHRQGKRLLKQLFRLMGLHTKLEHHHCDVIGWLLRGGSVRLLSGEVERTPRNAARNTLRNFDAGCRSQVSLVPDERMRVMVRRRLIRALPRSMWTRVGILTETQIVRVLRRLEATATRPSSIGIISVVPHSPPTARLDAASPHKQDRITPQQ